MLTYNMDVTPESVWKRTTPSEAELSQPYYCTEAGQFYAQQRFSTARTDKESYLLFYTLRGAGLIEQNGGHVILGTGQALLLNCRTPQSYCTAPGQGCWNHYWVHLDGAGVAAMEPLLIPDKKLTPVQITGVKMQELFEVVLQELERSTVDSMVQTGLALHEMLVLCTQSIFAQAESTSVRQVILQAAETLRKNYRQELCLADLLADAHMSKITTSSISASRRPRNCWCLPTTASARLRGRSALETPAISPPALPMPPARARCNTAKVH